MPVRRTSRRSRASIATRDAPTDDDGVAGGEPRHDQGHSPRNRPRADSQRERHHGANDRRRRHVRARGDSSGRFSVSNVPSGTYELRVVSIGYQTSRDTLTVPSNGASVEVTQVIMRFLDEEALCGYLAVIDSEPVLALAQPQSVQATHALPSWGSGANHTDGASDSRMERTSTSCCAIRARRRPTSHACAIRRSPAIRCGGLRGASDRPVMELE